MRNYQCHKQVEAGKIVKIINPQSGPFAAVITDTDGSEVKVEQLFLDQHKPEIGGYLVRYPNGYLSYSPAEPFESGYSEIVEE